MEYVQIFSATLDGESNRDAKIRIGRPDAFYAKLFTRRDLFLAIGVREINNVAISVRRMAGQCAE
jgi:hypothetical protein